MTITPLTSPSAVNQDSQEAAPSNQVASPPLQAANIPPTAKDNGQQALHSATLTEVTIPLERKINPDAEIYSSFPELAELSPGKFDYQQIFYKSGKQGYQNSDNRLNVKIIKALHEILTTKVLQNNEQVKRLARGIAYYPSEILYANGLLTMLSNYFVIVCTNERLILVNINRRTLTPTRYIYQLPYNEIAKVGRGAFLSSLIIENIHGKKWNFTTVGRRPAKSTKGFIVEKSAGQPAGSAKDNSLSQLCPACFIPLPAKITSCPHCAASFKSTKEARIRSLILPGLGSIYLSYLPLGIMEMIGYLAIWLVTVTMLIIEIPGGKMIAIIPVLIYHLCAAILAGGTGKKGYLLENKAVEPTSLSDHTADQ